MTINYQYCVQYLDIVSYCSTSRSSLVLHHAGTAQREVEAVHIMNFVEGDTSLSFLKEAAIHTFFYYWALLPVGAQ